MNDIWALPENKATYILRFFLTRPPYSDEAATARQLRELLEFCRRARVEAVQLYSNFLTNWYYMPDTVEHSLEWAKEMKTVAGALRREGISYQLNFQMLLGGHTGMTDMRHLYDWEYLVDHTGVEVQGCACPLGARFRQKMGKMLEGWAATEPDVLWVDDDFRMHNHQSWFYLDWYCYCPEHLAQFSRKMGVRYTRESLVAEIMRTDDGEKTVRLAWLDFLNAAMAETAAWISQTVHAVSPATRIAQMTSSADIHSGEGRNWNDFLTGLAGKHKPITRPHFGPYTELSPLGFLNSYTHLDQMMKNVAMQYERGVDFCPELENTRFTRWAKSVEATRFQLRLAQLLGCTGITLSLFDLEGTPLAEEPKYERLLVEEKAPLNRLAELGLASWRQRGVALVTDPELARKISVAPGGDMVGHIGPARTWDSALLQLGVPAFYASPEAALTHEIVALDGRSAWLPDDAQLKALLSRAVLLDANAAEVLIKRGFAAEIGISATELKRHSTSAELFHGAVLPGMSDKRMPIRMTDGKWKRLYIAKQARTLTTIVDPLSAEYPGTVLYENRLGGKIAVYAGCVDVGFEFYNHQRISWAASLLEWLGGGRFPLLVRSEHRTLVLRRDGANRTLLAFANLSADRLDRLEGTLRLAGGSVRSASRLANDGSWETLDSRHFVPTETDNGEYGFDIPAGLQLYNWEIVLVEHG